MTILIFLAQITGINLESHMLKVFPYIFHADNPGTEEISKEPYLQYFGGFLMD